MVKILMVNKFLHPNGGSETYVFRLGAALEKRGHQVQYFGMAHEKRIVGNRAGEYVETMDLRRSGSPALGLRVIYSREARQKIRRVLEDFQPDVCHLNNFHYQLTPSILLEIRKWSRETGKICRIISTAHDYQLVCPNHMCRNRTGNCEKCLDGRFWNCVENRCIHGSLAKSIVGAAEGYFWRWMGVYREIEAVVCCSEFLKEKLERNPHLRGRLLVMHNFAENIPERKIRQGEYVLYFGRFAPEKGVKTLVRAAKELPDIPFVFAGEGTVETGENVWNVGFQTAEDLKVLIRGARFAVCPSEWYENCPLSVLESLSLGTPVLAANIGGLPELISPGKNGDLFESGNWVELKRKIGEMWQNTPKVTEFPFDTVEEYAEKMERLYGG